MDDARKGQVVQKISIVIPVFNEEANLVPLFAEIAAVVPDLGCAWESLFVDDGSTDGSLEVIRGLVARHPQVRAVEGTHDLLAVRWMIRRHLKPELK